MSEVRKAYEVRIPRDDTLPLSPVWFDTEDGVEHWVVGEHSPEEEKDGCLRCGKSYGGCEPEKKVYFLCTVCTHYFLEMSPEEIASEYADLKIAYEDTRDGVYEDRMQVLDMLNRYLNEK